MERAVDADLSVVANVDLRNTARAQMLDALPMPAVLPPYSHLFADADGFLWVQTSWPGDSVTTLRALDAAGRILADVTIPKDMTIFEVGPDYVLGAYEDRIGEPHVALYGMHRDKQ